MKYLEDFPPIFITTIIINPIIINETSVSGMDKRIIDTKEETIVMDEEMTFGIVCEMTCRIVSTSFV